MILLDTNLLARINNSAHAHCAVARRAVTVLRGRGEQLVIVPQTLYEFWAVATRKAGAPPAGQNGQGMTSDAVSSRFTHHRWLIALYREKHSKEVLTNPNR